MTIPSFSRSRISPHRKGLSTPRILILDVKDKDQPEGETIAYVIVEREESYDLTELKNVRKATIRLTYEIVSAKSGQRHGQTSGSFEASYSSKHGDENEYIFMTSANHTSGALYLDLTGLKGQRIGTYLFSQIVIWAQQWPDAKIHPITLMEGQAQDSNRERRNRFYERYGIEFVYDTQERRTGKSKPMKSSQLNVVRTWSTNIRETDPIEYIRQSREESAIHKDQLTTQQRANNYLRAEINKARNSPFFWMLDIYAARYATALILFSIAFIVGFAIYRA